MEEKIANIIGQIKHKLLTDPNARLPGMESYPTVSLAEVEDAEQQLGFKLPELLRRIYMEVANGGFGPYYRIVGLKNGWFATKGESGNLVELYINSYGSLPFPPFPYFKWPEKLLPICELSWDLFCLDCNKVEVPVIKIQTNLSDTQKHKWELIISSEAVSFQSWIENWLNS